MDLKDVDIEKPLAVNDVASRRVVSRMLVNMLISESLYKQAAEVVLGTVDRFKDYSAKIHCIIGGDSATSPSELKAEIAYMQWWSQSVLAGLPDRGQALLLRKAFAEANRLGTDLLRSFESQERTKEECANASIH